MSLFISLLAFLVLAVVFSFVVPSTGEQRQGGTEEKKYKYQRKHAFMTNRERDFYKVLKQVVDGKYTIFAQVHLPTIIDEKVRGQNWRAARAHINRKSVDFVLCDNDLLSPKLAIELDDSTHAASDRQQRDREVESALQQAHLPLLRVLNTENLSEKIAGAIC